MIRFLPFLLIIVLILGGLGYFRFIAGKETQEDIQSVLDEEAQEVPNTLPKLSLENEVDELKTLVNSLESKVNSTETTTPTSSNAEIASLQASIVELKARVSVIEKATPRTTSSSANTYIPLGSGGGSFNNQDWYALSEYEISLNPDNFPNYTGMVLEATFRLDDPTGTASVRLYNVTDASAISSQLDSTSTTFTLKSSSSFKLPTGTKTYRLQVKSSGGKNLFVQTARIKVTF